MARETILKTTIRPDGRLVIEMPGYPDMEVHPDEFPRNIQAMAAAYGIREKATNAAALGRDPKTGKQAPIVAKRDAVLRVLDNMRAGNWELRGGGTGDDVLLVEAVAEAMGEDRDVVRSAVEAWDGPTKKAMTMDPKIKPIFDRMKAEAVARVAGGIDTKALLAGFGKK